MKLTHVLLMLNAYLFGMMSNAFLAYYSSPVPELSPVVTILAVVAGWFGMIGSLAGVAVGVLLVVWSVILALRILKKELSEVVGR